MSSKEERVFGREVVAPLGIGSKKVTHHPRSAKPHAAYKQMTDDRRPIASRARAAFYLLLAAYMNFVDLSIKPHYCTTPRGFLYLTGVAVPLDDAIRYFVAGEQCFLLMDVLFKSTTTFLVMAAISNQISLTEGTLFRTMAPIGAACGMIILECIHETHRSSSKRWLLPTLCCVVLAVDDARAPSVAARRACCDAANALMAAACISKLTFGMGYRRWPTLAWATGDSLKWSLVGSGNITWLKELIVSSWLQPALAAGTLFVEGLGAINLATPLRLRAPLTILSFLSYAGLHLGILATMRINYVSYILCYLTLAMPWAAVENYESSRHGSEGDRSGGGDRKLAVTTLAASRTRVLGSLRVLLVTGTLAASLFCLEEWPLTSVSMYSYQRNASWDSKCLTAEQARQLAYEPHSTVQAGNWFDIQVVALYGEAARLVRRPLSHEFIGSHSIAGGRLEENFTGVPTSLDSGFLRAFSASLRDDPALSPPDNATNCVSPVVRGSAAAAQLVLLDLLAMHWSQSSAQPTSMSSIGAASPSAATTPVQGTTMGDLKESSPDSRTIGLEFVWFSCSCGRQLLAVVDMEGQQPPCMTSMVSGEGGGASDAASAQLLRRRLASKVPRGVLRTWCYELMLPDSVEVEDYTNTACEPYCFDEECTALSGDNRLECGGCKGGAAGARCWPGAVDFGKPKFLSKVQE